MEAPEVLEVRLLLSPIVCRMECRIQSRREQVGMLENGGAFKRPPIENPSVWNKGQGYEQSQVCQREPAPEAPGEA